jgi:hypothetical protein
MASVRLLPTLQPDGVLIVMIFVAADNQCAAFAIMIRPIPLSWIRNFSTGCYAKVESHIITVSEDLMIQPNRKML